MWVNREEYENLKSIAKNNEHDANMFRRLIENTKDMYKVYCINSKSCYRGLSLVAADNAEEANSIIERFKDFDKDNKLDSLGYELVDEDDVIKSVYSEEKGIMLYGIYYIG